MNIEDFFSKVDATLNEQKQAAAVDQHTTANNLRFQERTVWRLRPQADLYAAELKKRGVTLTVNSASTLTTTLKFNDGGYQALTLASAEQGRLEMTLFGQDDKSVPFTSRSGTTYDEHSWNDELYISQLQDLIKNSLNLAARRRGLQ